ncbi:YetF domain-containing protein [Shouchella sp. 1P09AA]|uniref:YetF domain-containing protein n=1 Tax=unclassified Shouchella TaxID=2893065 RepID=UPI0039A38BC1
MAAYVYRMIAGMMCLLKRCLPRRKDFIQQMTVVEQINRRILYPDAFSKHEKCEEFKQRVAIPLIVDGEIYDKGLIQLEKTELWLRQRMRSFGFRDIKQISYCSIKAKDRFFIDPY